MASWFERVRAALAPKGYDVERELASGGMGTVFLARQRSLGRPVAVKIIRPELHTAVAVERFREEAQILAGFSHPNIVPIHDAAEADGMPYYVMEYLRGDTVADRLRRGALPAREARKLGRDLLAALEAAHKRGVIHRDVKPSNIFLVDGRAVLVDFGIAKRRRDTPRPLEALPPDSSLTVPGAVVGTLDYMPPEQACGEEATERSDLYAAAMVIYEAYAGRHWFEALHDGSRRWEHVPGSVARVLARGLEELPERRWPDATSFRRPLWHTRDRPYQWRAFWIGVGSAVTGAIAAIVIGHLPPRAGPALRVEVAPFEASGGGPSWAGDSVARALMVSLGRYPDVVVQRARWWWPLARGAVLRGAVASASGSLHVVVRGLGTPPLMVERRGFLGDLRSLADSLADDLYPRLLGVAPLDSSLFAVRPTTPDGTAAFLRADQLFAQARWGEAYAAYGMAAAADTACWLCYWRQAEVGRWLGLAHDRTVMASYLAHIDAFPPSYQSLIRADTMPLAARLAALERVTRTWPDFLFGQFRRAEELMHRGPLVGHARAEATARYEEVLRLRPRFGPAFEHLAWIHIANGDSADAATALAQYRASSESSDVFTIGMRALLQLAFSWRFESEQRARALLDSLPGQVESAGFQDIDAGARFLPYFGDWRGAIAFGRMLEDRPRFRRSGMLAQAFGYLGAGRPDSARGVLQRLVDRYADAGLGLFLAEFDATTLFLDDDSAAALVRWPGVRTALEGYASLRGGSADQQRRARWMLSVVASRLGMRADAARHAALVTGEAGPRPLATLLQAVAAASAGGYAGALELSDPLTSLEPGRGEVPDPFFVTLLHVLRAGWSAHQPGSDANARRELLWHEHSDLYRYPTGDPQPAEVDWALALLAERLRQRIGSAP